MKLMGILESSSEEEEDDLLRQTGTLLAKKVSHLPAGIIDIKPLPDGNLHKKAPVSILCSSC